LIVLAECYAEDDRCDIFEAVDPLLSLTSLTTHIKHASRVLVKRQLILKGYYALYAELAHLESCLVNTSGLRSCAQDVCLCGSVVWRCDSIDFIEEAVLVLACGARCDCPVSQDVLWGRVHQVELVLVIKHLGDAWVLPKTGDCLACPWVKIGVGIRVYSVLHQEVAMLFVRRVLDLDIELSHGAYEGLCAVDQVLEYRVAVERELVVCVSIIVYNIHLLDDGALAAFSRAYERDVSTIPRPKCVVLRMQRACRMRANTGARLPYLAAISCIHGAAS
jgi:hypothetical protein